MTSVETVLVFGALLVGWTACVVGLTLLSWAFYRRGSLPVVGARHGGGWTRVKITRRRDGSGVARAVGSKRL